MLKQRAPIGPDWIYEIKWDGYRIAVHIDNGKVRILTRGGHDWTHRFPAIAQAALRLGVGTAILDGEAVVLDERGRSDFNRLQESLGGRGGKANSGATVMYAFDLLYFDGRDIRTLELTARRYFLKTLLKGEQVGAIRMSESIDGDGDAIFNAASEHGLEGIVAKYKDAPYRSGRLGEWIKIKCVQREGFAIVGYQPSMAGIGCLFLAAKRGDDLVYVGTVGTGFTAKVARELRATLDRMKRKTPAIAYSGTRTNVAWVRPTLVADVEYRAWTGAGKLRHAAYKGLRDPEDGATIYDLLQE